MDRSPGIRAAIRSKFERIGGTLLKPIIDILDDLEDAEEVDGPGQFAVSVAGLVSSEVSAPSSQGPSSLATLLKQPVESLEDVSKLFKAAKSAAEIYSYAQDCSTPVWLDWLVKLSPKQVKMSGQMDIRAAFVNLGPPRKTSR
jgi:hypothetical protein